MRILQNCLLFHNFGCTMGPATNFLEERVVTTKACTAFPVMLARHIIPHLPPQQKNFVKDRKKTQHVCVIFRKQPVTSSLRIKGSMCYTLGWPRTKYCFAKPHPIFKFRTVLNSWDHSTSKLCNTFCCMTLFKGRAFALNICTFLH